MLSCCKSLYFSSIRRISNVSTIDPIFAMPFVLSQNESDERLFSNLSCIEKFTMSYDESNIKNAFFTTKCYFPFYGVKISNVSFDGVATYEYHKTSHRAPTYIHVSHMSIPCFDTETFIESRTISHSKMLNRLQKNIDYKEEGQLLLGGRNDLCNYPTSIALNMTFTDKIKFSKLTQLIPPPNTHVLDYTENDKTLFSTSKHEFVLNRFKMSQKENFEMMLQNYYKTCHVTINEFYMDISNVEIKIDKIYLPFYVYKSKNYSKQYIKIIDGCIGFYRGDNTSFAL